MVSFDNTEYAFAYKNNKELKKAKFLFSSMGKPWLVNLGLSVTPAAIKMNIPFTDEEAENYLHLWNVIGYFLGVEEPFLPDTMKESFWLDKLIAERQFAPSEEGKTLTKALLAVFEESVSSFYNKTAIAQMRFLLGDKIADMVDVPKSTLFSGILAGVRTKNLFTK